MSSGSSVAPGGSIVDDVNLNFVTVFLSIALYNVLELTAWILGTFKRWNGLYFWSLCVATWGIAFNSVGYLLTHRNLTSNEYLRATLILVGWTLMVNGQSLVLYSRLHLILRDGKRLRAILWMIIFDGVTMCIPIWILVYGRNSANPGPFSQPYNVFEKIQLTVFFVQETIISVVYVWETVKLMRVEEHIREKGKVRRLMLRLIYINIAIILLDTTIPALEFSDNFMLQTSLKPFAYSIKLKLEFSVLSQLVSIAQRGSGNGGQFLEGDIVLDSTITEPTNSRETPSGSSRLRSRTTGETTSSRQGYFDSLSTPPTAGGVSVPRISSAYADGSFLHHYGRSRTTVPPKEMASGEASLSGGSDETQVFK